MNQVNNLGRSFALTGCDRVYVSHAFHKIAGPESFLVSQHSRFSAQHIHGLLRGVLRHSIIELATK